MNITLIRKWPRKDYIIGQMYIDGKEYCHTMEPGLSPTLPKGRGRFLQASPLGGIRGGLSLGGSEGGSIPSGTYRVEMYPSAKFRGMRPILLNVPGRSGILIHEGNYPKDTKGCILVGKNTKVGMLSYSKNTLTDLMARIKASKDETYITIK